MSEERNEAARQAKELLRDKAFETEQDENGMKRLSCTVNGKCLELVEVFCDEYWSVNGVNLDPRLVVRELAA